MNKLFRLVVVISTGMILVGQPGQVRATNTQPDPLLLNNQFISAGENHTCAVTGDGKVRCWGDNQYGQLGDGTSTDRKTPIYVSNLKGVTAVSVGRFHTCALLTTGGVKCWGANGDGQLGDGTNDRRLTPVSVSNLASGVTAISAGSYHSCALTSIGGMKCWGNNYDGQLGDDTTTDRNEPVTVFLTGILGISAGWAHTCAVTTTNAAKCWGNNIRGQLGDGTTDEHHSPVGVSGLISGVTSISAGGFHTCALVDAGIKCWGWNNYGQLGDTHTSEQHSPVNVFWLGAVPSVVSAGGNHTCARDSDGGARCWGWNNHGQLGDNSNTQRTAPVTVSGLVNGVSQITTGHMSSCALLEAKGEIKCWGYNGDGQLGDGTLTDRDEPVYVLSPRMTFRSRANRDGWILESGENSDMGGTLNTIRKIVVGDNATDKQYRSILHFNTSTLSDNATIIRVELKIRLNSILGTDPLTTHGLLQADIMDGTFGDADLEITDFEAPASRLNIGHFGLMAGSLDWYRIVLGSSNFGFINLAGMTQFRVYFATGDNDDNSADQLKFYSGDDLVINNRPQLIIEYVLP
jgi:alpha-tubulin suppressor-like RCC1 family protein